MRCSAKKQSIPVEHRNIGDRNSRHEVQRLKGGDPLARAVGSGWSKRLAQYPCSQGSSERIASSEEIKARQELYSK